MLDGAVEKIMEAPWSYRWLITRDPKSLLLCFSINDSLRIWSSWSVYLSDMQFFLRRIEWPRVADRIPMPAVGPTTFGSEALISKASAEGLIDSAYNLLSSTTPLPKSGLMIDGVYCSISVWRNGEAVTASWVRGRKEAAMFEEWLQGAEAQAKKAMPESAARALHGTL